MNEKRKKDNEIAMLKRKIRTLEIFIDEVDGNDEGKDDDEDSDCGASWMNEKRKKGNEIVMLKRKFKTESTLKDM